LPFGPTPWGSRLVDGEQFHDGIDLATFCGDRIVAAHDGRVLAAGRHYDEAMGWRGDLGPYLRRLEKKHLWITLPNVVVVDDGNGYRSVYAHFGRVAVKRGQEVRAGQLLGYEGATGRASGCHLHYGLFAPAEPATFGIRSDVVKRMRVPALETARVDPLLVLPERKVKPAPAPAGPVADDLAPPIAPGDTGIGGQSLQHLRQR
jgi:murein DD-endopeptidase MepM/ murein hydrolase activator NlpD